jgi:hypothetical protein
MLGALALLGALVIVASGGAPVSQTFAGSPEKLWTTTVTVERTLCKRARIQWLDMTVEKAVLAAIGKAL